MKTGNRSLSIARSLHLDYIPLLPVYIAMTGSLAAGAVVSQLMRLACIIGGDDGDEPFYHTDDQLRAEVLLTEWELREAKKIVKTLPFIKTVKRGLPAKTYYQVDWGEYEAFLGEFVRGETWSNYLQSRKSGVKQAIEEEIALRTSSAESYELGGRIPTNKERVQLEESKEKSLSRPFGYATASVGSTTPGVEDGKKSKKELHPRWLKMAARLHEAIQSRHKVNKTAELKNWGRQFELLHTRDGAPKDEIKATLSWYCAEYVKNDDPYLQVAESGRAFREKYTRIRNTMKKKGAAPDEGAGDKDGIVPPKSTIVGHMSEEETKAFLKSGKRWDEAE